MQPEQWQARLVLLARVLREQMSDTPLSDAHSKTLSLFCHTGTKPVKSCIRAIKRVNPPLRKGMLKSSSPPYRRQ
jgi:hypothetical protein